MGTVNERNSKELLRLGFTYEWAKEEPYGDLLYVHHSTTSLWAIFTGDNYQSELSAFVLGVSLGMAMSMAPKLNDIISPNEQRAWLTGDWKPRNKRD